MRITFPGYLRGHKAIHIKPACHVCKAIMSGLTRRTYSGSEGVGKTARPCTARAACDDAEFVGNEVGALGLLIYQAAKQGSAIGLRFALRCKGAKDHINYQDKTTQVN